MKKKNLLIFYEIYHPHTPARHSHISSLSAYYCVPDLPFALQLDGQWYWYHFSSSCVGKRNIYFLGLLAAQCGNVTPKVSYIRNDQFRDNVWMEQKMVQNGQTTLYWLRYVPTYLENVR